MGILERAARKHALRGATVLSVDCRGCMASDHRIEWVGIVEGFEKTRLAGEAARVRIVKKGHQEARDVDLGYSLESLDNGAFQQLAHKLWAVYH